MKLGDNVKYTDKDGNMILAVIQAKTTDNSIIISIPGGETISIAADDVSEAISEELDIDDEE